MKLLILFILLTHASVNYGAKLISVKKGGRFIQLKLSEHENLSLIVGSPVWVESKNNNLKSNGYMIHKSGRLALVELTKKLQGLKPGDVLQLRGYLESSAIPLSMRFKHSRIFAI